MRHVLLLLLTLASAAVSAQSPTQGRKVVFEDQFDSGTIDPAKWNVILPKLVDLKGGKVSLGFNMTPDGPRGGNITTNGKFEQQFGYFEVNMRFNSYLGHRGVFGVRSVGNELPAAGLTFQGGGPRAYPWARISSQGGSRDYPPEKGNEYLPGSGGSKKFNTYGILWTDKAYTFYINGKKVMQIDKPQPIRAMALSVRHEALESDRKDFKEKNLPDDVEVDWVKIWK
ncbi:MAG: glycoside hydrolase family 16 protein [Opitutales bacterium]